MAEPASIKHWVSSLKLDTRLIWYFMYILDWKIKEKNNKSLNCWIKRAPKNKNDRTFSETWDIFSLFSLKLLFILFCLKYRKLEQNYWVVIQFADKVIRHNPPLPGLPVLEPDMNHDRTDHNTKPMEHWYGACNSSLNQFLLHDVITLPANGCYLMCNHRSS